MYADCLQSVIGIYLEVCGDSQRDSNAIFMDVKFS